MEGWGATAHSPGLVIAHVYSCALAVVCRRLSHAWLSLFLCVLFRSWACVVVRYRGAPLGGWWILVGVRGVVVWWLVVCRLSLWVM